MTTKRNAAALEQGAACTHKIIDLSDSTPTLLPGKSGNEVNIDAAYQYLTALDHGGKFTFQTFDDSKTGRKLLARILHGTLDQHAAALTDLNDRGAGIFVTVNETDLKGRTRDNITRVRAVFVDLDGAPLEPVKSFHLEPHIIVESSPDRWHSYWLVDDLRLINFSDVQLALAGRFGGDPKVKDLPRVMRLPGFIHQKGLPFQTRLVKP